MYSHFIVLELLCLFSTVFSTVIDECLNVTKPIAMRLKGCEEPPCKFLRGETMSIEIDFGARNEIHQMTAKVLALALGIETKYPLPNSDVCRNLINGECPLDPGEEVTFTTSMPILTSFPKVHVIVELFLESENGIECCMRFSGNVVDP